MDRLVRSDDHYLNPDTLPASWRNDRCIVMIRPKDDYAVFVDLDHPDPITFLDRRPRGQLNLLNVSQLDRGFLYSSSRLVTRAVSEWACTAMDDQAEYLLHGGVRYESRLSKDLTCWANFEGLPLDVSEPASIETDNESLRQVAQRFALAVM